MTKLGDTDDTTRLMQDAKSYQSTKEETLDASLPLGKAQNSLVPIIEFDSESVSLSSDRSSTEDVVSSSPLSIEDSVDKNEITDSKPTISLKLLAATIVVSRFVFDSSESMIAAFYPLEANKRGVQTTLIGLVFSSLQVTASLSSFVVPKLMRLFSLKRLYIFCFTVFVLSTLLLSSTVLLTGNAFASVCIILRMTAGFGIAVCEALGMTTIMTTFPNEYRPKLIALIEVGSTIAFSTAPVFGGLMYNFGGYITPYLVVGSLGAVLLLINIKLTKQMKELPEEEKKQSLPFKEIFVNLDVLSLYGCILLTSMTFSFALPILALRLREIGFPEKLIGLGISIFGISYGIGVFVFGVIADKFGKIMDVLFVYCMWGVCLSSLTMGPSPLLPFLQRSITLICISEVLRGFHNGIFPTMSVQAFANAGARSKEGLSVLLSATVSSHLVQLFYIGTFLGPLISGSVNEHFGFAWATTTIALIFGVYNVFYTTYRCLRRRNISL
ncbi:MFS-type transporter SLC18B1-like isoform X1 [Ptychodera flava]|uniref:MFS-type transporter SLC18B1-like isoform X1 n=1 Tax=Ptychodera flava TaxID=63121 RepID=UPI00396A1D14